MLPPLLLTLQALLLPPRVDTLVLPSALDLDLDLPQLLLMLAVRAVVHPLHALQVLLLLLLYMQVRGLLPHVSWAQPCAPKPFRMEILLLLLCLLLHPQLLLLPIVGVVVRLDPRTPPMLLLCLIALEVLLMCSWGVIPRIVLAPPLR